MVLVLLPFLAAAALDALGWRRLMSVLGVRPLSVSFLLEGTLSRGSFAHALHRRLSRLPGRAGRWFALREQAFAAVDEDFQRFGHGGDAVWPATAAYLAAWTLESVETWAILKLLGAEERIALPQSPSTATTPKTATTSFRICIPLREARSDHR